MPWIDTRVVGQREQLLVDVGCQRLEAAIGKIGATDAAGEEHVAAEDDDRLACRQTKTT